MVVAASYFCYFFILEKLDLFWLRHVFHVPVSQLSFVFGRPSPAPRVYSFFAVQSYTVKISACDIDYLFALEFGNFYNSFIFVSGFVPQSSSPRVYETVLGECQCMEVTACQFDDFLSAEVFIG